MAKHYQTQSLCPACGEVMDTFTHPNRIPEPVVLNMLLPDGMLDHLDKKPDCGKDPAWGLPLLRPLPFPVEIPDELPRPYGIAQVPSSVN